MQILGFILLSVVVVVVGCGKGGSSGSSSAAPVVLTAHMAGAVKAGRVQSGYIPPTAAQAARAAGNNALTNSPTVTGVLAGNDLVGIDVSGNLQKVFSASIPVYTTLTTTNMVIVDGKFSKAGDAPLVDGFGKPIDCLLLAFPKISDGDPSDIKCLFSGGLNPSTNLYYTVGDYAPGLAGTNAAHSHYGVATRGSSVYFTDYVNGILYKWTEGDSVPTAIFTQPPEVIGGVGMDDVFLDPNSNNICILYAALQYYQGAIYCGTDSGLTQVILDASALAQTRMLGKWLVTTDQKIDITNVAEGAVSRTYGDGNGGLPAGNANIVPDGTGGTIQLSNGHNLTYMDSSGNTATIANLNTNPGQIFEQVSESGSYAWSWSTHWISGSFAYYYLDYLNPAGVSLPTVGQTLNRIALTNPTALESTNYLAAANMDYMNYLALNGDGTITVYGFKNGSAVTAVIDGSGNVTPNAPVLVPLDQVVPL